MGVLGMGFGIGVAVAENGPDSTALPPIGSKFVGPASCSFVMVGPADRGPIMPMLFCGSLAGLFIG